MNDRANLLGFLHGCVRLSIRHARLIVVLALLGAGYGAYYAATHVAINTDTSEMLDPALPFRQTLRELDMAFPQIDDNFVIVIDGPNPEIADRAHTQLTAALKARPNQFGDIFSPGTEAFFHHAALLYLDLDELDRVASKLADAEPALAALAADPSLRGLFDLLGEGVDKAVEDGVAPDGLDTMLDQLSVTAERLAAGDMAPLSWQQFLGEGGNLAETRQFITVQPRADYSELQPAKAALATARTLAAEVAAATGAAIGLTGKIALNAEEMESVSQGAALSGLLSFLFVAMVLSFGLRSARLSVAALVVLLIGLILTAAFALATIGSFNLVSVAFAVLFIGLGIDFAIHFVLRHQEEIEAGRDQETALLHTAGGVGVPLSLAAFSTAIAFYAFVPTAYSGLSQLGLISGTGIVIALLLSLTLLPALLTLMPLRPKGVRIGHHHANFVERHHRPILALAALAGVGALMALPKVHFDFDPAKLKDPNSPSVVLLNDLLAKAKNSPYPIQLLEPDQASAERTIAKVEAWPEINRVVSLDSFIPKDQEQKLELIADTALFMTPVLFPAAAKPAPSDQEQAAAVTALLAKLSGFDHPSATRLRQALSAYDAAFSSEPKPYAALDRALTDTLPDLFARLRDALAAEPVTLDQLPPSVRERYQAKDGRVRVELYPRDDMSDQKLMRRFVERVTAEFPDATGHPVQLVRAGEVVVTAVVKATLTALAGIFLLLLLVRRSVKDAVLILTPVALAGLLSAAATVWLGISINFASVIVLPLLLGLGVDSGIHLLSRARENQDAALTSSTPRAVLLSALTTIGSFASLALSHHQGTASMGELLSVSISLSLISTLLVFPGLLHFLNRHR